MASQSQEKGDVRKQAGEFYTNSIESNFSLFEFEVGAYLMDSAQNVKAGINLRMSPATAWTLAQMLTKQLGEFEKRFGPLHIPDEMRKALS